MRHAEPPRTKTRTRDRGYQVLEGNANPSSVYPRKSTVSSAGLALLTEGLHLDENASETHLTGTWPPLLHKDLDTVRLQGYFSMYSSNDYDFGSASLLNVSSYWSGTWELESIGPYLFFAWIQA